MKTISLRIATRKSPLALWQANFIKHALETLHPNLKVELLGLLTQGDKWLATPLYEMGGKALFVKELEKAILEHRADIAVHSIKDMPTTLAEGLTLATICARENPYDAFISNSFNSLEDLPANAIVGTSSLRRQCQLKALRPDLSIKSLRGNVGTRIAKLDAGEYHAIILAATGLNRLNLSERIRMQFAPWQILPAAGQGAIGIECRENDTKTRELLAPLDHPPTRACVMAERAVTDYLGGSCQVPIAAYAQIENRQLTLQALVGDPNGQIIIRSQQAGEIAAGMALGHTAAQDLLAQGANEILESNQNT